MTSTPASTPIGDHMLTHADGRRLAWSEWGRAQGPPVLLLHRNPGSRLLDPDSAATAASEVQLITIDRPGYGGRSAILTSVFPPTFIPLRSATYLTLAR
jgi:pimeloyl-ACP methyl ester carboxylesterase